MSEMQQTQCRDLRRRKVLDLLELPVEETQVDAAVHRRQVGEEGSARRYGNNCENVRLGRKNMRRSLQKSQQENGAIADRKMVQEWPHVARRNRQKEDVTNFMPSFIKKMYLSPAILCDTVGTFAIYLHTLN